MSERTSKECDIPNPCGWNEVSAYIERHVSNYEMYGENEKGQDACYQPSDSERAMIADAINGLLGDWKFSALLASAHKRLGDIRAAEGCCRYCGCKKPAHWGNDCPPDEPRAEETQHFDFDVDQKTRMLEVLDHWRRNGHDDEWLLLAMARAAQPPPAVQCDCPAPGTSNSSVSPFCRVHASSQPPGSEWQPIETAPSGETILVAYDSGRVYLTLDYENDYEFQPYDGIRERGMQKPTHWMKPPVAPCSGTTKAGDHA